MAGNGVGAQDGGAEEDGWHDVSDEDNGGEAALEAGGGLDTQAPRQELGGRPSMHATQVSAVEDEEAKVEEAAVSKAEDASVVKAEEASVSG